MQIDLRERTASFRVLYAGPERATKFLNLRRLQETFAKDGEPLRVMHTASGRVLSLDWSGEAEDLPGYRVRTVALAAPGRIESQALEDLLVQAADAIVFLPARDDPGGTATREAFEALSKRLVAKAKGKAPLPLIIQDYADGPSRLEDQLVRDLPSGCSVQRIAVKGDVRESAGEILRTLRGRLAQEVTRTQIADQRSQTKPSAPKPAAPQPEEAPLRERLLDRVSLPEPKSEALTATPPKHSTAIIAGLLLFVAISLLAYGFLQTL